jgi:hypothetical protein
MDDFFTRVMDASVADEEYQQELAEPGKYVIHENGTLYYKNHL